MLIHPHFWKVLCLLRAGVILLPLKPVESSDTLTLTPLSHSPLVPSPCNEEEPQTRPKCKPHEASDITTAASTPKDTGLTTTAPTSRTTTPHQVNSTSNASMHSTILQGLADNPLPAQALAHHPTWHLWDHQGRRGK